MKIALFQTNDFKICFYFDVPEKWWMELLSTHQYLKLHFFPARERHFQFPVSNSSFSEMCFHDALPLDSCDVEKEAAPPQGSRSQPQVGRHSGVCTIPLGDS